METFSKAQLHELLKEAISREEQIFGAWLGGSSATGHEDGLSDTDLVLIGVDFETSFKIIEEIISEYRPITQIYQVPGPTLFKNTQQRFYLLQDSPETYFLDVVVFTCLEAQVYQEFFNQERHGQPIILTDKRGILGEARRALKKEHPILNHENHLTRFEIIYRTFQKESMRGKYVDSHLFYQRLIQILVEVKRILYSPQKHDFGLRYLYYDLPKEEAFFIEQMLKVSDLETMKKNANLIKEKLYQSHMENL